jgi:hypothetical protein
MSWKFKPVKPQMRLPYDDPTADGTDYAHPAYWRGEDMGVYGTSYRVFEVLTGEARGLTGCRELNKATLLIQDLRALAYAAIGALQWCSDSQDFAIKKVCEPVLRDYQRVDTCLNLLKVHLKEKHYAISKSRVGSHSSRRYPSRWLV